MRLEYIEDKMEGENTPRIQPIPVSEWNDEVLDALNGFPAGLDFVLTAWKGGDKNPRGARLLGTLAQHPALAKAFLTFNGYIARVPSLTPRIRELLILRLSWLRCAEYEYVQHLILGRRAGLTDEELRRIESGPDAEGWSAEDADLLRAVDELIKAGRISAATWSRLAGSFNTQQLMDIIFVVGCYEVLALAVNSFGTPFEPGAMPLDPEARARMQAASGLADG